MADRDPNVKDLSETGKISQEHSEFLRDLRSKVGRDDDDRAVWKNKIVISNNQRLGVKRYTNHPYPGAPDIPLPETDKIIKKSVAPLVMSAWGPKNPVKVNIKQGYEETEELKQKRIKAELAMNMVVRSTDMAWFKKLCLAADNLKHYGHCIFRVYEEFCSNLVHKVINIGDYPEDVLAQLNQMPKEELVKFVGQRYELDPEDDDDKSLIDDIIKQFKSGNEIIEFDVEKITSYPQVDVVNPARIIVPAYTEDINQAERLTYEYWLSRSQIETLMDKKIFIRKDLSSMNMVSKGMNDDNSIESSKSRNEGINDNTGSKDLYRIRETCCWKKDGKQYRRKVYTFLADVMDPEEALLQDIQFPFEFKGWNYEKHDNEIKDTRYFNSRGEPEKIRALQEMMERAINNMIIRDEVNNTPAWEVLDTSEIMDAHIPIRPNQKIPVKSIGAEIKALNPSIKVDSSSERIMQMLKAYTEEYVSIPDQLFNNSTNEGGGKTLGEVKIGMAQNRGPINLDVLSWNDTLSKVYTKIFYIMSERLGDSIHIGDYEITREDFLFPAEIVSNGNLELSDQEFATQKAAMRLQTITNPIFQTCVNAEDIYNAMKDWLEKDGVKDPDRFCTDPKIIMQEQITKMQQQAQQMGQQIQGSEKELEKNQKDSYKAKRLEKKHINQAEAGGEEVVRESAQKLDSTVQQGQEILDAQGQVSQALTGRTADELLAGSAS